MTCPGRGKVRTPKDADTESTKAEGLPGPIGGDENHCGLGTLENLNVMQLLFGKASTSLC